MSVLLNTYMQVLLTNVTLGVTVRQKGLCWNPREG